LWYELEPVEFLQGTLLRDSKVRLKNRNFTTVNLKDIDVLIEEAPGGHMRLVNTSNIQVGDTIKWLTSPDGSLVLIHCLNANGAALNRYNVTSHWKTEIKERDLLENLYTKAGIKDLNNMILTHNNQGRVIELNIIDNLGRSHSFTGMRIRLLLGLKDNVFRFITIGDKPKRRWIVYGRGWGHGVGMDQTGAYGMALEGANFKEILEYYYKGIQLKSIEEIKSYAVTVKN
jgi:stage II sporulation protein D